MKTEVLFVTVWYPLLVDPLTGKVAYAVADEVPVCEDTPVSAVDLMFPGNCGVECSADDHRTVHYDVPVVRVC